MVSTIPKWDTSNPRRDTEKWEIHKKGRSVLGTPFQNGTLQILETLDNVIWDALVLIGTQF